MRVRQRGAGPRLPGAAGGEREQGDQYVVGQVSGSLGAAAAPAAPLARLFRGAAPPVLVALPGVSERVPGQRSRLAAGVSPAGRLAAAPLPAPGGFGQWLSK